MFWTQCVTDEQTLTECLINTPILYVWSRCEKSGSDLGSNPEKHPASLICESEFDYFEKVRHIFTDQDEQKDLVWIHIHINQGGGVFSERPALVLAAVSDRTGVFSLWVFFFSWQTFNWPWICTESEDPRSELRADLKGHKKKKTECFSSELFCRGCRRRRTRCCLKFNLNTCRCSESLVNDGWFWWRPNCLK